MSEGDILLDVRGIHLTLEDAKILEDVSFHVIDRVRAGLVTGQVVSVLGPSGIGKTRLLRIIAGLDAPDAGEVHGQDGAPLPAGSVGVVFQDYPLLRHRTVEDNLVVAGTIGGLDAEASKKRAKELLKAFDLAERASFYPAQLSGGQRQRAAIAQQIVVPRRLLLMDEPFSGLDPAACEDVMKLLVDVANLDELNTIVVVTHDIRAALAVSDTVFMLGRKRDGAKTTRAAHVRATYDLVALDLAWHADVHTLPQFVKLEHDIKAMFRTL